MKKTTFHFLVIFLIFLFPLFSKALVPFSESSFNNVSDFLTEIKTEISESDIFDELGMKKPEPIEVRFPPLTQTAAFFQSERDSNNLALLDNILNKNQEVIETANSKIKETFEKTKNFFISVFSASGGEEKESSQKQKSVSESQPAIKKIITETTTSQQQTKSNLQSQIVEVLKKPEQLKEQKPIVQKSQPLLTIISNTNENYITSENFDSRLNALNSSLLSQIQNLKTQLQEKTQANFNALALTNKIDRIPYQVVIPSPAISSPNISGTAMVEALTTTGAITVGTTLNVTGAADITGNLTVGGNAIVTNGQINVGDKVITQGDMGVGTSTPMGKLTVQATATATTSLVIWGIASQTAPYFQIFNSSGAELINVNQSGNLIINTNSTLGNATTSDIIYINSRIADSLVPTTDNVLDIGDGTNWLRWRTGYFGTSVGIAGTATSTGSQLTISGAYLLDSTGALSLNTTNNSAITTGTGLFTIGGSASTTGSFTVGDGIGDIAFFNSGILNFLNQATTTIRNNLINAFSIATSSNATNPTFVIDTRTGQVGRIGIGTSTPTEQLAISERLYVGGTGTSTIENNFRILGTLGVGTGTTYITSTGINFSQTGTITSGTSGGLTIPYASSTSLTTSQGAWLATTGGNVGIGTTSPWGLLAVNPNGISGPAFSVGSSTKTDFVITNSGNVGIGKNSTTYAFEVQSSANIVGEFKSTGSNATILWLKQSDADERIWALAVAGSTNNAGMPNNYFYIRDETEGNRLVIDTSGNVGIGTTSPQTKLEVVNTSSGATADQLYLSNLASATSTASRLTFRANDITNGTSTANITSILTQNYDTAKAVLAFSTLRSGLLTEAMRIMDTGNVGVGTTSPAQLFSVAGQCVTGDTLVRVRRRRKKYNPGKDDPNEKFEHLTIPIIDIRPGDEVFSLNEKTNEFEYHRVNGLIDTGVNTVYRLKTSSGRYIETTANHPYLVRTFTPTKKLLLAFADETGIGPTKDQPFFGVGTILTGNSIGLIRDLHNIFGKALKHFRTNREKLEFKFKNISLNNLKFYEEFIGVLEKRQNEWTFGAIFEDKRKIREGSVWENYLRSLKEVVGKQNRELVIVSDFLSKPHASNMDLNIVRDMPQVKEILQLESQGSLLLQMTDILVGAINFHLRNGKKEAKKKIVEKVMKLLANKKIPVTGVTPSPACYYGIPTENNCQEATVDSGWDIRWTKVSGLKVGQEIGVMENELADHCDDGKCVGLNRKLKFETIVSIENTGEKQTYDIEVDGTHNFVAGHLINQKTGEPLSLEKEKILLEEHNNNISSVEFNEHWLDEDEQNLTFGGIVAHNTYITGGLGVGQTETTAGNITGTGRLSITSTSATSTFSTGGLTVGTSQFVVQQTSGNVGIGTTTPGAILPDSWSNVSGTKVLEVLSNSQDVGIFLRSESARGLDLWASRASGDVYMDTRTDGVGSDLIFRSRTEGTPVEIVRMTGTGNVGIGTTSPYAKLSVHANAADTYNANLFAIASSTASATTTHFVVTAAGNVGIGTTGPNYPLEIVSSGANTAIMLDGSQSSHLWIDRGSTSYDASLGFITAGTQKWAIGMDNDATDNLYITSGTSMAVANAKVTFLASGNVGIGTTTPNWLLQAAGTRPFFTLSDTGASANLKHWTLSSQGGNFYLATSSDALATSTIPALTVNSNGNVGIGTTTPGQSAKFGVAGDAFIGGNLSLTGNCVGCGSGLSKFIKKANNEIVNNSAVLQDDDDFVAAIGANETWVYRFTLHATSSVSADIKFAVTAPSGAQCGFIGGDTEDAQVIENTTPIGCGETSQQLDFAGAHLGYEIVEITGSVVNSSTAGNVTLQWAQNLARVFDTIVASSSYMIAFKITGSDVAEIYYTDDWTLRSGEIVSAVELTNVKRASAEDEAVLGVISEKPGFAIGEAISLTQKPVFVALSGRVPVKVNLEGGEIKLGDRIAVSSVGGIGKKAGYGGDSAGIALENLTQEDYDAGKTKILMFVKLESNYRLSPKIVAGQLVEGAFTGIDSIYSRYFSTTSPAMVIDENGNIGIGYSATSTLSSKFQVQGNALFSGDIAAQSFVNISTESAKKDITYITADEEEEALAKIKNAKIAQYNYLGEECRGDNFQFSISNFQSISNDSISNENSKCQKRLGLIAEQAPPEVLSADSKGVDLYKMTSMAWLGLKAQQKRIENLELGTLNLEERIRNLELGTLNLENNQVPSSKFQVPSNDLFQQILGWLSDKVIQAREFVGERIIAKKAVLEELEMKDSATGEIYCVRISNGEWVKEKGLCAAAILQLALGEPTPADTEPPTIILQGNNPAEIPIGSSYSDLGAVVTDNVDENLGIYVFVDGVKMDAVQIDTSAPGEHTIDYVASDQAGNTATSTRTVIIYDPYAGLSATSTTQ